MSAQYFAQLDDNNVVTDIAVVQREFLEANPQRYTGRWVQTFFDTAGKTYAGIGMEYMEIEQDFREQQPYPSWTWLNKTWTPPTPYPNDGQNYFWDEADQQWVAI